MGAAMMEHLLFADGDAKLLEIYQTYFTGLGYAVQTACSGLVCLACLRPHFPDLLILDQSLPWGGGDGVLARLREAHTMCVPPVIFTGRRDDDRQNRWPVIKSFHKPIRLDDLDRTIRSELVRVMGPI
jgi:DNA-binding response OmpR family regulator